MGSQRLVLMFGQGNLSFSVQQPQFSNCYCLELADFPCQYIGYVHPLLPSYGFFTFCRSMHAHKSTFKDERLVTAKLHGVCKRLYPHKALWECYNCKFLTKLDFIIFFFSDVCKNKHLHGCWLLACLYYVFITYKCPSLCRSWRNLYTSKGQLLGGYLEAISIK